MNVRALRTVAPAHQADNIVNMNVRALRTVAPALQTDKIADMNGNPAQQTDRLRAAEMLPAAGNMAIRGLLRRPAPAAAGDTALPAVRPVVHMAGRARRKKRRSVFAFNRERFSFSRLQLLLSR